MLALFNRNMNRLPSPPGK